MRTRYQIDRVLSRTVLLVVATVSTLPQQTWCLSQRLDALDTAHVIIGDDGPVRAWVAAGAATVVVVSTVVVAVPEAAITGSPPAPMQARQINVSGFIPDPQAISSLSRALSSAQISLSQLSQTLSQTVSQLQSSLSSATAAASAASASAAAASSSAAQAIASASQAVASASSSAAQAVASASTAIASAQASAASVQAAASQSVADAQSKASAAQASVDSIRAEASKTKTDADNRVTQAQGASVSVTQAAIAVIASILGSALITLVGLWLLLRYRRQRKESQMLQEQLDEIEKEQMAYAAAQQRQAVEEAQRRGLELGAARSMHSRSRGMATVRGSSPGGSFKSNTSSPRGSTISRRPLVSRSGSAPPPMMQPPPLMQPPRQSTSSPPPAKVRTAPEPPIYPEEEHRIGYAITKPDDREEPRPATADLSAIPGVGALDLGLRSHPVNMK